MLNLTESNDQPVEREGWVNIYPDSRFLAFPILGLVTVYLTEEEADKAAANRLFDRLGKKAHKITFTQ